MAMDTQMHISEIFLLNSCMVTMVGIFSWTLAEKPLTMLIEQYNQCVGASFTSFKASKEWIKPGFEIVAGSIISKVNYTLLSGYSRYPEVDFKSSFEPVIGLNLNLSFPRISEKFSSNIGMFYIRSNYSSSTYTGYPQQNIFYNSTELKIPLSFRYTTRVYKSVSPFCNFGISKNVLIDEISDGDFKTARNHGGFFGGAGAQLRIKNNLKGFFEIRYEYSSNMGGSGQLPGKLQAHVTNLYTLISIKI